MRKTTNHGAATTATWPVVLLLLLLFGSISWAQPADYLPADLRARVDQLKTEIHTIPTNATNIRVRAELTWQWLNAYALNGGYVPVNSTQTLAYVLGQRGTNDVLAQRLNETIEQFAYLDSNPDAFGSLEADLGPFEAGSTGTITQTYTVGEQRIQTGGGIMVARHFMTNFGTWQVKDPTAPNYLSVDSNNPKVSFVATSSPMRGMHGGFRGSRPTTVFKIASGTLNKGDTVTLQYGDTRGGSQGMKMPTFSSDRMPLPLYVSFANNEPFFSLPIQPIKVSGTALSGVAGFAPSIVKPNETFEVSIRAQDAFFNRAQGSVPDWQVMQGESVIATIKSTGAITIAKLSLTQAGAHHLTISNADGSIAGTFNPILVTAQDREQIFWGDTHGHSGFAEGIGTPERFMVWAKEDARLDYVTHSEHDIWLDDAEWEVLRDNVQRFNEEGKFAAYLGYEWSVNTTGGGHHNVLFRNPQNRNRISSHFYPTLSSLYHGLRSNADTKDVVVIPHAHQAGDYRLSDPALEPLIEIMSQHGNFEWFGRMYLDQGHQVGFTAASDNHLSQPGYSAPQGGSLSQRGGLGAIFANKHSTDAIFDGMKSLRAYATTGDRIILDFAVNETSMGQRGPFAEQRSIKGHVIGTAPIDTITVFKNNDPIWQQRYVDKTESRIRKKETFMLSFESDSDPFHPNDNPRGWRTWDGTLEVHNAQLVSIEPRDSSFPTQSVQIGGEENNQARFATKTRGDTSSYLIKLSDVKRTTRLNFDMVEAVETGGAPPVYRPPQRVPASSFALGLRDMEDGLVIHEQRIDGYIDTTTLRKVITDGARELAFEIDDTSARHGDFYYVRIVQTNDAIAWSSPVWIGGHAAK